MLVKYADEKRRLIDLKELICHVSSAIQEYSGGRTISPSACLSHSLTIKTLQAMITLGAAFFHKLTTIMNTGEK